MDEVDEYTPDVLRPRRSPILSCGFIVLLIAAYVIYLCVNERSRYVVTGVTDSSTKYRVVYTVSSRYRSVLGADPQTLRARHELEEWEYVPTPMSAPLRWYYTYILRRNDAAAVADSMSDLDTGIKAHSIQQTTFLGKNPQGNSIDAKGFVKPPDLGGFGDYAALDQSMSSNCAVTWYALDRPDSQNGKPMRYYYLYIHPKGRSITFMFSGISDAGQEPNDVLDELSLIRESIRIEKIR